MMSNLLTSALCALFVAAALQRYKHMFEVNQKYGSFYLQSKVYRAWEALDQEYTQEGKKSPEDEAAVQRLLHQDPADAKQDGEQQQQQQ
jgi:import inner membrane translocase subunit TIM16